MATILNIPDCASPDTLFNTGKPLCDFIKGIPKKGILFLDKGKSFSAAELATPATLIAAIKTATTAARGGRVYPIWDINNFEEETGDPSTGGVGNMSTETIYISDPIPAFKVGYGGGEIQHSRISLMSGGSYDVMIIDDGYVLYGTKTADGGMKGWSTSSLYVYPSKFRIADAVNQYAFRLQLADISEYREQAAAVKLSSAIISAYGLISVQLSKLSNASNVYKIQAIADGGTNLEPVYGTAISALTWTATAVSDGSAFTITSVADDTTLDAYTVTFDSTLYTALASGGQILLKGPLAAALAGASVAPYEFISVILTK